MACLHGPAVFRPTAGGGLGGGWADSPAVMRWGLREDPLLQPTVPRIPRLRRRQLLPVAARRLRLRRQLLPAVPRAAGVLEMENFGS
jgi:hypothetical protein